MFEYRPNKEIHIHLDNVPSGCLVTYCETEKAIEDDVDEIHTTLTYICSWRYCRRIFIHVNGVKHEITMGKCEGTDRTIREGHNLERLLITGEFDWF